MKFDFSGKNCDLPRVPNYLGGRDQKTLSFWVLGGGFLLLLACNFQDFARFAKSYIPRGESVDTRLPLAAYREPLPYEAVQLLPTSEAALALGAQDQDTDANQDPAQVEPSSAAASETAASDPAAPATLPDDTKHPEKALTHGKHYSAVDVPLLKTIQDRAPFRATETGVWYHLFDVVNKAPPEQLKKEATRLYDFATIFGQSNYYRGQAIAMTGIAKWYRQISDIPQDNAAGIPAYYEIGFQTNPREDNPIIVYVIDLPADLPRGKPDPAFAERFLLQPGVPMSFEGIFFKNAAYSAADGNFRLMPTLIAKTIRVKSDAADVTPPTNPMLYLMVLLCLGGPLLLGMYFMSIKRKKLEFHIPGPPEKFSIPESDLNDSPTKESWPVLPPDE